MNIFKWLGRLFGCQPRSTRCDKCFGPLDPEKPPISDPEEGGDKPL